MLSSPMAYRMSEERLASLRARFWGGFLVAATFAACGGQAFTSQGGDGDGDGDTMSGDGDVGDGDVSPGDGDGDGDGDVGDGDVGPGDGDGDGDGVDRSCLSNSDCLLVPTSCCGNCGVPSTSDMTAVRVGEREAHFEEVCGPEPAPCPACAEAPDPNLYTECVMGTCEAVDLRTHSDSECSSSVDDTGECVLTPDACCPCGAGTTFGDVVAINASRVQGFRESQCAEVGMGEPVGCAECEWMPPNDLAAECIVGRCTLTGSGVPPQ